MVAPQINYFTSLNQTSGCGMAQWLPPRVERLPGFKFTGKSVKKVKFTGKIGKIWQIDYNSYNCVLLGSGLSGDDGGFS